MCGSGPIGWMDGQRSVSFVQQDGQSGEIVLGEIALTHRMIGRSRCDRVGEHACASLVKMEVPHSRALTWT